MDDALRNSPVHIGMFVSALRHALGDPGSLRAYEEETGRPVYAVPGSAMERMVDRATGRDFDGIRAFAEWFRDTQWGKEEAPDFDFVFEDPSAG